MDTPIACDMTGAPDTAEERMAEWGRLIAAAYTGRERTATGIRLRFRADAATEPADTEPGAATEAAGTQAAADTEAGAGIEAWIRDLAAREKACCPFFDFDVTTRNGEVWWDISVIDDDIARAVLDDVYGIPDTIGAGLPGMEERLRAEGLTVTRNPAGTVMRVHRAPG